jgi:SAM-dependent methyltransferase
LIPSTASIRGTDTGYRAFHAPRYRFLLELIDRYAPAPVRVLDIGLSPFTTLLRAHLDRPIDSLGLEPASRLADGAHYQCDLNALDPGRAGRPPLADYDVIVYAEVLEHLHTPPLPVLRLLHDALAPNGILVLQTPNAASLSKRVRLLFGIQPYEMIRDSRTNPGHFREYTLDELRRLAHQAGFELLAAPRRYYFDARFADIDETGRGGRPRPVIGRLKNLVYARLPPFLREGITMVLRRPAGAVDQRAPTATRTSRASASPSRRG